MSTSKDDTKVIDTKISAAVTHPAQSTVLLRKCFAAGTACGISGFTTNPFDVVKIRNQQYGGGKYGKFFDTFKNIYLEEKGVRGLLKGAKPTVVRELTYSSFRMGMYEPIKDLVVLVTRQEENSTSPVVKWCSAFLSGGIGSALFNPIDLIKVRFQSNLPGQKMPYNGSIFLALKTIYKNEGLKTGLYKGSTATVIRAALLTSGQLGTYDVFKNNLLVEKLNFDKNTVTTHLLGSLLASLVATTVCNPADVIKTRMMNDVSGGKVKFSNVCMDMLRQEGAMAFMKGWTASYSRIGPHTVISFILVEQIRRMIGLSTY